MAAKGLKTQFTLVNVKGFIAYIFVLTHSWFPLNFPTCIYVSVFKTYFELFYLVLLLEFYKQSNLFWSEVGYT